MEETKANKPKWLRKLEQESWQAELIISGLAILGALQLPEAINNFGEWALTYFSRDQGLFIWVIVLYLFMASSTLIIGFISHFVLRAVWVGLIGINSVFPKGIRTESDSYSKTFMENIKRDFSIKNSGIEALDRICSGIFAVCAIVVLVSIVLTINILVIYGLKNVLEMFLPNSVIIGLGVLLFSTLFANSILMMVLNSKKYQDNVKVQEKGYKVYKMYALIFFHAFNKPYFYLTNLIMSNVDKKQFIGWLAVFSISIGVSANYNLFTSKALFLFDADSFFKLYERTDRANFETYEEHLTAESGPIYSTLIEAQLIQGEMMKIFIPIFPNEESIYTKLCGEHNVPEEYDRDQERAHERKYYTDCYNQYHRVSVNDQIIANDLVKYDHPHRNTEGVLTYISTEGFKAGKNLLKVEKLSGDSSKVYRTMVVPFWFAEEVDK